MSCSPNISVFSEKEVIQACGDTYTWHILLSIDGSWVTVGLGHLIHFYVCLTPFSCLAQNQMVIRSRQRQLHNLLSSSGVLADDPFLYWK
uniref:Uncharacterized protein n=1 Tax=Arundo donax TaxID=35708 RepID=A0A0A8ZCT9_ARUDO